MSTKTAKKQPEISTLWPVSRAAEQVGVSRTTLDSAVRAGHCESHEIATGMPLVTLAAVRAWLATERRRGPRPTE